MRRPASGAGLAILSPARAAFKLGAYDFIQKPLDLEVFRNLVNRAAETVLLRHQNDQLKAQADTALTAEARCSTHCQQARISQ